MQINKFAKLKSAIRVKCATIWNFVSLSQFSHQQWLERISELRLSSVSSALAASDWPKVFLQNRPEVFLWVFQSISHWLTTSNNTCPVPPKDCVPENGIKCCGGFSIPCQCCFISSKAEYKIQSQNSCQNADFKAMNSLSVKTGDWIKSSHGL